ncbi:MAG: hypothetical protein U5N55_02100 [Cypionkella sp.]|nr:hypothetical protein [Cypionkella sp.]
MYGQSAYWGILAKSAKNCLGYITVSPYEHEVWKTIYPNLLRLIIQTALIVMSLNPQKKKIIAFTERGGAEGTQIRSALLLSRAKSQLFEAMRSNCCKVYPRQDLAAELAQASIYMQASLYESFGLLAGEAVAAGCIFAGSDGGSDAGISPEWAYSSRPTDTLGLLQALKRLDQDLKSHYDNYR